MNYETCLGCDVEFIEFVGIGTQDTVRVTEGTRSQSYDSGYQTSTGENRTQPLNNSNRTNSSWTNRQNQSSTAGQNRSAAFNNNSSRSGINANSTNSGSSSHNSSEQQWSRNVGVINNDTILCNCHEPAIELTVRKEGPNQGNNKLYFHFLNIEK